MTTVGPTTHLREIQCSMFNVQRRRKGGKANTVLWALVDVGGKMRLCQRRGFHTVDRNLSHRSPSAMRELMRSMMVEKKKHKHKRSAQATEENTWLTVQIRVILGTLNRYEFTAHNGGLA